MSKDSMMQAQSQSVLSQSSRIKKITQKDYLDKEKIQRFYQDCQRLKKFVESTSSLSLQQNEDLNRYMAKFQKTQIPIHRKNHSLLDPDIIHLAEQRVQRMIKSQKPRKNWTLDDRTILDWVVIHFALVRKYKNIEKEFTKQDWKFVASLIPGANTNSCMFKWLSLHKTNLNEANWSEQESELLKQLVSKYVTANKSIRWKDVCKKLYLQNLNTVKNYRTQKQCKEHWVCKLNPNIKRQPWTQEEDILLLQTIKQNSGLKKWVQMVKLFQGRTQNAVKNRYNLIIQKQKKCIQTQKDELDLIEAYLQRCYVQKFTKIIEPDSQQRKEDEEKNKNKKSLKNKKCKKAENKLILNCHCPQTKNEIGKPVIPNINTEGCSLIRMKKVSLIENSAQQTAHNDRNVEDFISIQNLSQIEKYNHRANDIEYEFMYQDSSMNQ